MGSKDKTQEVVSIKMFRGAPISTRLGGLVDRTVDSCRGVLHSVGMDVKGYGSRYYEKGGY